MRFAIRPQIGESWRYFAASEGATLASLSDASSSTARAQAGLSPLTLEAYSHAPVAATSVAGAYFLARRVASELRDSSIAHRRWGALDSWLSPLGSVPLGPAAGAFLRQLLDREDFLSLFGKGL